MKRRPILFHTQILVFAVFASILPCVAAFAQRTVSFQITVQEPRAGFVRQAVVDLECRGAGCQGGAPTLTLTRSGNVFSGTYDVPNSVVDVLLVPYVRFAVDNAAFPNVGWRKPNRDPMKFTDPHSPTYRTYTNTWSVDFRELTVQARYWDGQTWVHAQPNVLIRGTMPAAGGVVSVAVIHEAEFVQADATIALPFGDHFLSPTRPLEVEGRLGATMPDPDGNLVTTQLIQLERAAPQFGAANEVRLEFVSLAWLEPIRTGIERDLGFAGVPEARAIAQVEFFIDPGQNGAEWRQENLKRDVWIETTKIALGPTFDHKVADGGDTLLHEWTHEIAYRTGWRSGGTLPNGMACPTAHSFGQLCPCEWMGWDEAVNHFAGSYLLGRALSGTSGLRVTDGASWVDTNADVRRGIAQVLLPACIQRFNRNNPGSWTEDVVAGALIELYRAEGFDTETQPLEALRAFTADWRGFAGRYGQAERTGRNFFLYKRANVSSPVPTVDARAVDQMGLWYLITTPQDVQALGPIEQLVPLRLETTTPRVQPDQQASFKASARAFHRLVGQYRNYGGNSIRVRLTESGQQVGNDAWFVADTANPEYNFAAQLTGAWPNGTDKPVEHRVRAEVWGNFIDGHTDQLLGHSDELSVVVESKKAADIAVAVTPPSVTLLPEAKQEFTATVTGTANTEVWWEATDYQGQRAPAGTITKTGPNSISYKAPSFPGKYTLTAWSAADSRKKGQASVDVTKGENKFTVELVQLPCVWEYQTTCRNNTVRYTEYMSPGDLNEKMILAYSIPPGIKNPENLKAVPIEVVIEYERQTVADDSANCPPANIPPVPPGVPCSDKLDFALGAGGNARVQGNKLLVSSDLSGLTLGSRKVKIYALVCNSQLPPAYEFFYSSGEKIPLYSGDLPLCTRGSGTNQLPPDNPQTPTGTPQETPKTPLAVTLKADKTKLAFGETAVVTAEASGGKPDAQAGYTFVWLGDHAGSGPKVSFSSRQPGAHALSVTVRDKDGNSVAASIQFTVSGATVEITKNSPLGTTVPFGQKATFSARLLGASLPNYIYRWEPAQEVAFSPAEGGEGVGNNTSADFKRPGKVRIWAAVLETSGAAPGTAAPSGSTVAESQPIELEVVAPKLSIAFDPMGPYVGQPTKARVALDVDIPQDKIDFAWELTNNARALTPVQGVREVTFIPKDSNRITVVAKARTPHYGDDLGSATATLVPRTYDVQAKVIGPVGAKPEGYDLVGKPGAIAAGQSVLLHADISPQPPGRVRFVWFAQGGTIENPEAGKEVTAHKNEPGSCQIVVRAEDDDHNLLGEGTTILDVVISKEEMAKAKEGKTLGDKLAQVKALAQSGKYEEAVKTLEEAIAIDREAAWPATAELLATLDKLGKEATGRRDWAAARRFFDMALRLNPQDGDAFTGRNNLQAYEQRDREVKAWCAEADALISQGRLATAEPKILSIQLWERNLPPPVSTLAQSVIQRYEQALASYKAEMAEARAKVENFFKRRDWEPALALLRGLQSKEMFKEDANWVGATIETVLQYQREDTQKKAQAAQLKAEGLAQENQGKIQDAIGKYRQSLGYWPDAALEGHTRGLEEDFKRRFDAYLRLYNEGHALESRGDLRGALAKYEEAYGILPNKDLLPIIESLRGRISQLDQEEQRKARAQQLVSEGTACEQRGDLNCAITKYEAAVAILPNQQVSDKITQLEAFLAQDQAHGAETITVPARTSGTTSSRSVLENGQTYSLQISGVFSYWDSSGRTTGADALYDHRGQPPVLFSPWSPLVINGKPLKDWIEASGSKAEYRSDHVYAVVISGNGKPLTLSIFDPGIYSDNSGSLTVKFGLTSGATGTLQPHPQGETPTSGKKGYWRLVDRKLEMTPSTSQCYPSSASGREGDVTVNARSVCGEDGIVTLLFKWTPPPEVLVPGEKLQMDSSLTPKEVRTVRGIAPSLTGLFDWVEVGCGGVGPGSIRVIEWYAAGYGKPGGSRHSEAEIPRFGALNEKTSPRMQLKLCSESWHQIYIYEWVDDYVPSQRTGTTPPVHQTTSTTSAKPVPVFDNYNAGGVKNGVRCFPSFNLSGAQQITQIETYHWNAGRGARGGTITLRDAEGRLYGPWPVMTYPGSGGAPDVYWRATPNQLLQAGIYYIVDSDPATWSSNEQSSGCGFAKVGGQPKP